MGNFKRNAVGCFSNKKFPVCVYVYVTRGLNSISNNEKVESKIFDLVKQKSRGK